MFWKYGTGLYYLKECEEEGVAALTRNASALSLCLCLFKRLSYVINCYIASFWTEVIKQAAENPADNMKGFKRKYAGKKKDQPDRRILQYLDQCAFFFRFFFFCSFMYYATLITTDEDCPPIP